MKNYLITGGSGGIGSAVVCELLKRNCRVFICDINPPADCEKSAVFIKTDVTDSESIASAVETVSAKATLLDGIINLAGVFMMQSIVEGDEQSLRKAFDINFWGAYRINRAFFGMLAPDARIINMCSELSGMSPMPFTGYYSVTKHALDCYTDVLRRELNYTGIKVIKIRAGSFKTGMLGKANSDYEKLLENTALFKAPLIKLKKLMTDELQKSNDPAIFAGLAARILSCKKPRICYRIKNSFKLRLLSVLPEKAQDIAYTLFIS